MDKKIKFNTKTVHKGQEPEELYGSVSLPIYQTSTFKQNKIGEYIYDYSRAGNPTRTNLEENICSLEGGEDAISFASGLAAISSIIQLFKSGDHIIFTENAYGGTYRLLDTIMEKFGVESSWVDTSSLDKIKLEIKPNTKLIFIETPTNPMMSLSDINAITNIAKEHNILVSCTKKYIRIFLQICIF